MDNFIYDKKWDCIFDKDRIVVYADVTSRVGDLLPNYMNAFEKAQVRAKQAEADNVRLKARNAELLHDVARLFKHRATLVRYVRELREASNYWAEQNRRAEAESHRRREELEIAIQRMIRKEQWARAWKRAAKTRRAWLLRYKERLGKAAEEDERLRAALLAAMNVIRHVPHGQTLTDGETVELETAVRLAKEALKNWRT